MRYSKLIWESSQRNKLITDVVWLAACIWNTYGRLSVWSHGSFVVSHILLAFPLQEILEQSCLTTTLACSYHLMLAIAGDRWASHQDSHRDQASWQTRTTVWNADITATGFLNVYCIRVVKGLYNPVHTLLNPTPLVTVATLVKLSTPARHICSLRYSLPFHVTFLTYDSRKINWILSEFNLAGSVSESWYCACWLTVTAYWDTGIEHC